jgi:hypothetical protein
MEKEIKDRRVFSCSNILMGLSILFLLSAVAYFYWPQAKPESKITDTTNSLLDISRLDPKQSPAGVITHPNESGTGSSSGSTANSGSGRNEKPHKRTAAIPKGEGSFRTVIGSSDPPEDDDDDDDEDPDRRRRGRMNEDGIYSDAEEESEEEESEDDDLIDDDDDEEMNWQLPLGSPNIPNVGVPLT